MTFTKKKRKTGNYIWLNVYVSPYDAAFRKLTTATVIMGNIILYGGYKFSSFFANTKRKTKTGYKSLGFRESEEVVVTLQKTV